MALRRSFARDIAVRLCAQDLTDPYFVSPMRNDGAGRPREAIGAYAGGPELRVTGDQAPRRSAVLHEIGEPEIGRVRARALCDIDRAVVRDGHRGRTGQRRSGHRVEPAERLAVARHRAEAAPRNTREQAAVHRPSKAAHRSRKAGELVALAIVCTGTSPDSGAARHVESAVGSQRQIVGPLDFVTEFARGVELLVRRERAIEHRDDA